MRLLFLCPHFDPDLNAATGEVMTKLVHGLAEQGHEINVVTSLPWYRGHEVEDDWRGRPWRTEKSDWGRVVRVWPFPTDKTNIGARLMGYGGFTALSTAAALVLRRPDAVLGMSPPIFLGDAARIVAKRWRAPMVFNTQDIFPDIAVELGALTNKRVIQLAERHEKRLYRSADAVTVLSTDQAENVRAKLDPSQRDKVRIIHNFVDIDRLRVVDRQNHYRHRHGLGDKTVIMYSGNVGLSQSFDLVRLAADIYRERTDIHFVINGEGAARPEVDAWAAGLPNVTVADFAPRDQVSEVLGAADIQLILLRKGLARSSTPSKLYANLAAGRPVLASIDQRSEVANVLAESQAGLSVPPEDPASFLAGLERMLADPHDLLVMGKRARAYVEQWMTPEVQAAQYRDLFQELVTRK